ncbi:MAG TPA: two-component sensor histidine kinase [Candidatus Gordonibacter avicola]|nr:two-component sensor histidine kinase [Candidatus Gordonibacter avicola]
MALKHLKVKSLAGKIFTSVLAFTLGIIVALAAVMTTIYYVSYEHDAEAELAASAQDAARYLNATPSADNEPILEAQFSGLTRYTLIAPDGTVLYDSAADTTGMDNHADRPEVQQAAASGEAVTMRYSETLGTDTVYAAVKLDDGSIVRLSETRHSLLSFLGNMLVPVLVALVVAVVLVFVLSRVLTSRIMKPIDALDFANPLDNEIYEEMDPLLTRIDEQQRQLKQQNAELAQAENLRRDFSSNVSHEMKTPLQVISGYAELMKNDMVQPADRQKFAALIYDEAQAMRSLITDVLTLSRLDEAAFGDEATPVDLVATAHRVAGRLESFAAGQGVSVQVEGACALIRGSETLAEEMLYNLIENGIRYNHPGGEVVVSLGMEPVGVVAAGEGAAAWVGARRPEAGEVVVRVSDTGSGIPADLRDKVFERFFRVDKSRSKETGGTGLGLAIVKHAVIYHGGTIEVEESPTGGTVFVLRLPAA